MIGRSNLKIGFPKFIKNHRALNLGNRPRRWPFDLDATRSKRDGGRDYQNVPAMIYPIKAYNLATFSE